MHKAKRGDGLAKPNFIIIGAVKCGTTSLYNALNQHPQVFFSEPKEPAFFNNDVRYDKVGWNWYGSLFAGSQGKIAIGEGSPQYTMHKRYPNACARIARDLPEAKLIYITRHPLKRIESEWCHGVNNGEYLLPFNEAVRKVGYLLDNSMYWRQINIYRDHFPDDRIHVMFIEDLKADPVGELRRCFGFLGLDPGVLINDANKAHGDRSRLYEDRILWRWIRRNRVGDTIAYYRARALPMSVQTFWRHRRLIRHTLRAVLRKPFSQKPQWDQTYRWAVDQLADDNRRFLQFYGKDEGYWPLDQHLYEASVRITGSGRAAA